MRKVEVYYYNSATKYVFFAKICSKLALFDIFFLRRVFFLSKEGNIYDIPYFRSSVCLYFIS